MVTIQEVENKAPVRNWWLYLVRDIKAPIHHSMIFFNEIFIYCFLLDFCIEIIRPFINLDVAQNAFHSIIKNIITQIFC